MKIIRKKFSIFLLSLAASVCFTAGGAFAFSQMTQAKADTSLETEFTNNNQFAVTAYPGVAYEYVDGASVGLLAGYEGAVLKIDGTSGTAYVNVDFSGAQIKAESVESIVVKVYSPNYNAGDSFRVTQTGNGSEIYDEHKVDMSAWTEITLTKEGIAKFTQEGYLTSANFGVRARTYQTYYIDSIIVNVKVDLEADFTNNGQFALSQYSGLAYEVVDGATESGLPAGYEGTVLKITGQKYSFVGVDFSAKQIKASDVESIVVRGYSPDYTSADEFRTIDTGLVKYVQYGPGAYDMSTWCDVSLNAESITQMTDGNGYLSSLYLGLCDKGTVSAYFYIDSITVKMKEAVTITPVDFVEIETAYGWNNNTTIEENYSATLLEFSAPLGATADATNQAANTAYEAATKIKLNGKSVNEWYQEDGQTTVSYAHGGNYLHIRIPVVYLALTSEEYPSLTLTIDEGTLFMNAELPAVKLVFNTTTQQWEEGISYGEPTFGETTNAYVGGWGWNHKTDNEAVIKDSNYGYTIITNWDIASNAENLAATKNGASVSITLNGKSFYELYQADDGYRLNSQLGYFGFSMPTAGLVAGNGYEYPTIEIVKGTPFYDGNYLPATTIIYKDGAWQLPDTTNYNPDFVSIGTFNHYDNVNGNQWGLSLAYDTTGFTTDNNQVMATSFEGFTLNGEVVAPALFGTNQLLFWLSKDKCVENYNGYSHATLQIAASAKLVNENGKTFTFKALTMYLVDDVWTTEQPADYVVTEIDKTNYNPTFLWINDAFNNDSNGFLVVQFDTDGWAQSAVPTSYAGISYNGNDISDLISSHSGLKFFQEHSLWFTYSSTAGPKLVAGYNGYSHPTIQIAEGATVVYEDKTYTFKEITFYLVNGKWTAEQPADYEIIIPEPLPYNGVAHGWNNMVMSGISNTILQFGVHGQDFLGDAANASNLAKPKYNAPIGTALTINGKTISELYEMDENVQVSYAHGFNYLYIAIPEYLLATDGYGCTTLKIADRTTFLNALLPEVTLYLYKGQWTTEKPATVETEDAEYTTISNLFDVAEKTLNGMETIESGYVANGSMVYNFLMKNDRADNKVAFLTHFTTENNGIKVVFEGDKETASERITLFVDGVEKASDTYLWSANEWFSVRVAVMVGETVSVSVAIDGVYVANVNDLTIALGDKVAFQNEVGVNTFGDYKSGDVKKPILYWQGKEVYYFDVKNGVPEDAIFQRAASAMDSKDGAISSEDIEVFWQDGAIVDSNLQVGTWAVIISASDKGGNKATHAITIIAEDVGRVSVTFDGAEAENAYYIGDLLIEPTAPQKENYKFIGWYVGDVKWDFVNDVVKADIALTARFVEIPITYTVVITSEGLPENYTYTFELAYGATIENELFVKEGFTCKVFADDSEIESITVIGAANYKVVYTEIVKEPDPNEPDSEAPDSEEPDSEEPALPNDSSSESTDNSGEGTSNSQEDELSEKTGCFGSLSIGGISLTVASAFAVIALKKKKED